jgi:hypothetical protein
MAPLKVALSWPVAVIWPPLLLKVPPLSVMLLPEAMMAVEALGLAEPALLAVSRSLVLRVDLRPLCAPLPQERADSLTAIMQPRDRLKTTR